MNTRRRRCVPSPAPEKDSKHFMKAILPPPDHTKEIRIPYEFITRFGNELDNVATITVPGGREWDMELKKCGSEVFFCNNWQPFTEYYYIYYGCYLDFKYKGNSKFNVVIYDTTSVEISYTFETWRTNGEPNIKCPSSASKRSKDAANEINPKNTSFRSKAFDGYAYVPGELAKEHLKPNVPFKLQNYQGKQWEVSCISERARKTPMRITSGFCRFARENNLSKEVFYNFKLIKRKPVLVLQVTASRTKEKKVRESKHFKKAILPSPIHDKQIYINAEFASKYLKVNVAVKLQNCNGEQWDVCCTRLGRSGLRFGKGFFKFATDNNLSNGDKCKVELIQKTPVVLQLRRV